MVVFTRVSSKNVRRLPSTTTGMKTTPSWTSIGIVEVSAAANQRAAGTVGVGPGDETITGGAVTLMPAASRGLAGGSGTGRGGGVGCDEAGGETAGKGETEDVGDADGIGIGEALGVDSVVALADGAGEAIGTGDVVGAAVSPGVGVGSDADDSPAVRAHAAMKTAAAIAKRRATTARAFASARVSDLLECK